MQALLSTTGEAATLHLQDYNLLVLQLVTLPNLLLAALPFLPADALRSEDADAEADQDLDGHLNITSAVKDAFKSLLDTHGIKLEFTYGHWAGLSRDINHGYDLVLTAETIYAEDSVNDLLAVLESATKPPQSREDLQIEDKLDTMSVKDDWIKDIQHETVILVAAKVCPEVPEMS
jgi:protein-histidine N-methyltransferase